MNMFKLLSVAVLLSSFGFAYGADSGQQKENLAASSRSVAGGFVGVATDVPADQTGQVDQREGQGGGLLARVVSGATDAVTATRQVLSAGAVLASAWWSGTSVQVAQQEQSADVLAQLQRAQEQRRRDGDGATVAMQKLQTDDSKIE